MGTKNNPGGYDCYAKAEPDEPMFVLLGRDPHAPAAVRIWAYDREALIECGKKPASDMAMVIEARECADTMERYAKWRRQRPDNGPDNATGLSPGETLCGTCRWWDHEYAERRDGPEMRNRIAPCLWGADFVFPEWCGGLRGDRFTNEAGTTKAGCAAWERIEPQP